MNVTTLVKVNSPDPHTNRLWKIEPLNDDSVWELEKLLDLSEWTTWIDSNPSWVMYPVSLYLIIVHLGPILMRNSEPYKLNRIFNIWNVVLAVYSILSTVRVLPILLELLGQENGFHTTLCSLGPVGHVPAFWSLVFILSKVVELGDTAFLVLRKKPITYLHWIHHAATLTVAWLHYSSFNSFIILIMGMNCFVHSIMYTYYLLKVVGVHIPKSVSMGITNIQILQMIIGVSGACYSVYAKSSKIGCHMEWSHMSCYLTLYGLYLVLFSNFFIQSYLTPKKKKLN